MSEGTKRRMRILLRDGTIVAGLAIFLAWTLAPIVWMLLTSVLPHRALITRPPDVDPANFTWNNIEGVLEDRAV